MAGDSTPSLMQAMDALLAFPNLILGLIIVAMLGASATNIIIAIAVTSIPPFARIARAPTIAIKNREFIEACRALGFSDAAHRAGARPAEHPAGDPGDGLALARQRHPHRGVAGLHRPGRQAAGRRPGAA